MWNIHPTGTSSARRVRLGRIVRPWDRNPLLRPSDRLQAAVRILAAIVILAAVPVSCSIGTALYTRAVAQIQADNAAETAVTATLSANPEDKVTRAPAHGIEITVDQDWQAPVVWTDRGKTDSATVTVPSTARRGGHVQV
ncbi:hypothetical protein [Nocardia miyunensis]|uniref:hypothetical protein n=1 Tax=Nocardia miyunensis TaxID=282684 RepID=UPI000834A9F0|nr:hypothetical protein [Nocardia miyunensis]